MANPSQLAKQLKRQIDIVSKSILNVEKQTELQIRELIKKTEKARAEQLKRAQSLVAEAKKFDSKALLTKAESLKKDIEKQASVKLQGVVKRLPVGSKKEVDSLKRKISALEKRLKALESQRATKTGASSKS